MRKHKGNIHLHRMQRILASVLSVAMLFGGNMSVCAESVSAQKQKEINQKNVDEAELKAAIRQSGEMEAQYPNGVFNFLNTQMEVSEGNEYLEICVIRQGGTAGEAKVKFKAIDITAAYGDDYKIYTKKKSVFNDGKALEKGEDAFPLIETVMNDNVDLSTSDDVSVDAEDASTDTIVKAAVNEQPDMKTSGASDNAVSVDTLKDASEPSAVQTSDTANDKNNTSDVSGSSLRADKEAATGEASDRTDWKAVTDDDTKGEVRENFDTFLDCVGGSETTLTFEDGEYIKYLYLVPEDDKVSESEEQLMLGLLKDTAADAVPVGDSYNAYVNIKDNEKFEASSYEFNKHEINTKPGKATVTIKRTSGVGQYDTIYVGTEGVTAAEGYDYKSGSQKVVFYAGQSEQKVSVDILDNADRQNDRVFNILISKDGEKVTDEVCAVTIPASEKADSDDEILSAKALINNAEKISPNGYSCDKGQWTLTGHDFDRSSSHAHDFWLMGSNGEHLRYENIGGFGWSRAGATRLYGASTIFVNYYNHGGGRYWETHEYYYKNGWNKFWGKKTWYWQGHREYNYGTDFFFANDCKWTISGAHGTPVGKTSNINNKYDWENEFGFNCWTGAGNHTHAWLADMSVSLIKFKVNINNDKQVHTTTYTIDSKDHLKEVSQQDATPKMTLSAIGSNVGNNQTNINSASYDGAYRSDCLQFAISSYDTNRYEFKGIQASNDNKTWKTVSSGYEVVLNKDFFSKIDFSGRTNIYFKPIFANRDAKVKFQLENSKKGTYNNLSENKEFTVHVGDTIKGISAVGGGNLAAYQPRFYSYNNNNRSYYTDDVSRYLQPTGKLELTLDTANSEGAVANFVTGSAYNRIYLSFENPSLTVKADPAIYRNTYTNLKYTLDGKTYSCSNKTELENFQKAMDSVYKAGTDKDIKVTFDYKYDTTYKNGKSSQSAEFGNPKYAIFTVYDSNGEKLKETNINPTISGTTYSFALSGKWKSMKWEQGTTATITIVGSRKLPTGTITSQETEVDFTSNSGAYVSAADSSGKLLTDSNKNTMGSIQTPLVYKGLDPLADYKLTSYSSNMFLTRWADYSLDSDNDGSYDDVRIAKNRLTALGFSGDLVKELKVYYGNSFNYQPNTYSDSKVYYDFVKASSVTGNSTVQLYLDESYRTVLRPDVVARAPLNNAQVTFAGNKIVKGDDGYYTDIGSYQKGLNYLVDIKYQGLSVKSYVVGTGYTEQTLETSNYMFPINFTAGIDGEDKTDDLKKELMLDLKDGNTSFGFDFQSSVGVKPNKAIVKIYDGGYKNVVSTSTVTRGNVNTPFAVSMNTISSGAKAGYTMTIQGVYDDGTVDHAYPEVKCGFAFREPLGIFTMASSFSSGFNKTLKVIGDVATKFDLPINYNIEDKFNKSSYTVDNSTVTTYQVAFGYNTDVMKSLKQQQIEHRADHKGEAMSGRDNVRQYMESLMGDDGNDDEDDEEEEEPQATANPNANGVDKTKDAADGALGKDAQSNKDSSSSFKFDFSVAVILTLESGLKSESNGNYYEPDGHTYFDSLALVASANADFEYSVTYTTPIGIDIIGELSVGGKAVVGFGVESDNANKYNDMFNLTKNKDEKTGEFKLNSKYFSMYTKFLIAPSITLGAGVGVGGVASVVLTGTADFNFGFTAPIMGNNYTSAGSGTVVLSVGLKLKILFIKKQWQLYKSDEMSLFDYGNANSLSAMMSDFEENYLYDNVDDSSNSVTPDRDYLNNRSEWMPEADLSTLGVTSGDETVIQEGVYPNPDTHTVDLGNGKQLMVFLNDAGSNARDEYNCSELFYSVYDGKEWSEPVAVEDDGTWDEAPNVYKIADNKVLITWSDASEVYTAETKTADVLSVLDISAVMFDADTMELQTPFAITETTDDAKYADSQPMISFDEETKEIMVYFTRADYYDNGYSYTGNDDIIGDDSDVTTYGDIINGYNVIAYCKGRYDEGKNEFTWDNNDNYDGLVSGYLNLAVKGKVEQNAVKTKVGDIESDIKDTVYMDALETVFTPMTEYDGNMTDPRVVDSDLISYNGLALYSYTMDFDANLETSNDRQVYVQIYNYDTGLFYHPIQLTSSDAGNEKPQFVRCKGMTYLYWLSGGDIVYTNISNLVTSLNSDQSLLKNKEVEVPVWKEEADGTYTQDGTEKVNMYILDLTGKNTDSVIFTAVEHEKETDENGEVTENAIPDFDVEANNDCVYVMWTALKTSVKDENASGAENTVRETQMFAAYSEPKIECVKEPYTFENASAYEYTFADGKDNTTYPVSIKALQNIMTDDGTVSMGEIKQFDYNVDEDLNGLTGVVKAGDKAYRKVTRNCDGYDWSKPVQITNEAGANYTDVSFVVNDDGEIFTTYARGVQKLNDNNVFEEDTSTKELCSRKFDVTSELQTSDVTLSEEKYLPGDLIQYSVDVTNDGLKPITGAEYRMYAEKYGKVVEGTDTGWKKLINDGLTDQSIKNTPDAASDNSKTDSVDDTYINFENAILGGNTETVTNSFSINETDYEGTSLCMTVKDAAGAEQKVTKDLAFAPAIAMSIDGVRIIDENTAELNVHVVNNGNEDYSGTIEVKHGTDVIASQDVTLAYDGYTDIVLNADIKGIAYSPVVTNEDGSMQDSIPLTVNSEDYSIDANVIRKTSAEAGTAYTSITKLGIGRKDISDNRQTTVTPVGEKLVVTDDNYLQLAPMLTSNSDSAEANTTVEWESSDPETAYVNSQGLVVPIKPGKVKITAKLYPISNTLDGAPIVNTGSAGTDNDSDFGTLSEETGSGAFTEIQNKDKIPSSLVKTASLELEVQAAPIATQEPTAEPTNAPDNGLDLSGAVPVYGDGTVTYDETTGSITGTDVQGVMIPLGKQYQTGQGFKVTVYTDVQSRMWLSDDDTANCSEQINPVESGKEYTLTATAATNKLQIKKLTYDAANYASITVTKVVVTPIGTAPTAAPTATPTVKPTQAPATATPTVKPTTAPSVEPTATAIATQGPVATTVPTNVPVPTAAVQSTAAPDTGTPAAEPTSATDKKLTINSIKAVKNKKVIEIRSTAGSKITVKVYKSLKYAKSGKKAGLIKSYTIKASKNKSGSYRLKLKKKLKANQAVLVTIKKTGYKAVSKTRRI